MRTLLPPTPGPTVRRMPRWLAWALFCGCWLSLGTAGRAGTGLSLASGQLALAALAQTADHAPGGVGPEAVEEVRGLLNDGWTSSRHPWYDSELDSVRRIPYRPPPQAIAWPNFLGMLLKWLGWLGLIVLLVVLAVVLYRIVRRARGLPATVVLDAPPPRTTIDRLEALPFPVQRTTDDLLGEARRQYQAGNYGEAVIYLFSYQLVELDRGQWIHLTRGKTNRQYLGEILRRPPLAGLLEQTMVCFEDVFFGHYPLERERFEICWHRVDEFHRLVREVG